MHILLIAATPDEIELFINIYPKVDILITGVGVPSTMYHLQKRLQQGDYDFVIQTGIAGSFSNDLDLGQTILVKQDTFADLGAEEKRIFTHFFTSGLINAHEFPFADGWLINKSEGLLKNSALKWVKAITINKVSDSFLQKLQLTDSFSPQIETMEGAALHYVCLQENIPFVQIRSVTNYVGERDKTKWKMKEAIENLNEELTALINHLTNLT